MVCGTLSAIGFSGMRARVSIFSLMVGVCFLYVGIFFFVVLEGWGNRGNGRLEVRYQDQKTSLLAEDETMESSRDERFLESPFTSIESYDEAFRNAEKNAIPLHGRPIVGITSHHFLARDLIAGTFLSGESSGVTYVIIVGPDHFEAEYSEGTLAFTSKLPWRTPFGEMLVDPLFSSAAFPTVAESDTLFFREHSIYTLVPFAKHFFPRAFIVPLVLKNTRNTPKKFEELGRKIAEHFEDEKIFVMISSDFSHDVSAREARSLDKKSIASLRTLPMGDFSSATNDCRSCLAFLDGYLKGKLTSFSLIENKTSADFGGGADSVTSYVSGVFVEQGN